MKGIARYFICVPALLFMFLAACQFKEPSLEIIAQEAYDSQSNILVQTRFSAEDDKHTCEYALIRESDSSVVASDSPVLPADTVNDHLLAVAADGRYLFDFHVLDAGGSPIGCLCDDVEFWVDTASFVSSPTWWYTEDTVYEVTWTVFLDDHPDNLNPELSPVAIYYNLDSGVGPVPDINSTKYDPATGIVVSAPTPPRIRTIAIDAVDHQSAVVDFTHFDYQP